MRLSRVVIGGATLAAAVAAGSAFTNSNTLEPNTVAGYGVETVSGATVLNTKYNVDPSDMTLLDSVVFTATGNLGASEATMVLRDSGGDVTSTITNCGAGVVNGDGNTDFTCDLATNYSIASMLGVALTVVSQ